MKKNLFSSKILMYLMFYLTLFFFIYCGNSPNKERFTGDFELKSGKVLISLKLKQKRSGLVEGTLLSSNGTSFKLEGILKGESAEGECSGNGVKLFFEAKIRGEQLILDLIEQGKDKRPDYSKTRRLTFKKISSEGVKKPGENLAKRREKQVSKDFIKHNKSFSSKKIKNPSWGFNVLIPSDWKYRKEQNIIIVGHDKITGAIFIIPHLLTNISHLRSNLTQGISNENIRLYLTGNLSYVSKNIISGDYTGTMNGTQVKAKGYGTISPYGGGVYIIAIMTPDKYSQALVSSASFIAKNIEYKKAESSNLMQYFAGRWKTVTKNSETIAVLYPNGNFSMRYSNSYGGNNGEWGVAGDENSSGRWAVRGSRRSGVLVLTYQDGSQDTLNYYVHVKNGQTYWKEYYFGGTLYWKE